MNVTLLSTLVSVIAQSVVMQTANQQSLVQNSQVDIAFLPLSTSFFYCSHWLQTNQASLLPPTNFDVYARKSKLSLTTRNLTKYMDKKYVLCTLTLHFALCGRSKNGNHFNTIKTETKHQNRSSFCKADKANAIQLNANMLSKSFCTIVWAIPISAKTAT